MFGKKLCLFFVILFAQFVQGQLSNFTLTVTKTDETCTANGSLTFSVSNTTAGATIIYSVFLLPDVTTPVSVLSATSISGLSSGTYMVRATQSLGSDSGFQEQTVTIDDLRGVLTYQLNTGSLSETCGNDAVIQVNVVTGNAVSYELFSGPMIRPLQPSNIFTGLTAGAYQVRVIDACGEAVVQTFTVLRRDTRIAVSLVNAQVISCTEIRLRVKVETLSAAPVGVIKYPLQVTATTYPQSGSPVVSTQTINFFSGPTNQFIQMIPFYVNQPYNYTISITDACGDVYTYSGIIQNLSVPNVAHSQINVDCTHQDVIFSNITALTMVTAPSSYTGVVPQTYLVQASSQSYTIYSLPVGTYTFDAADLCGVVQHITIEITASQATPPYYSLFNRTCSGATAFVFNVSQLILVSAPPDFGTPLPHEYSGPPGGFITLSNFPVGTFVFNILDSCGNPSILTMSISPNPIIPFADVLEGCDTGEGSVEIVGDLAAIRLVSAPTTFTGTLPYDYTSGIVSGSAFSVGYLPAGDYVFEATDSCGLIQTVNATISGYQESTNVEITPHCGSFDFYLEHTSNNSSVSQYWFQEFNPQTNQWFNPLTNIDYPDGGIFYSSVAIPVTNNAINYNFAYTGHFRIVKVSRSYGDDTSYVTCIKVIHEFDFFDTPRIVDVFTISCGNTYEAVVQAEGNSTLTYRITTKDGQPFLIENGNSNLFSGLAPATYNFQVEDACGNRLNSEYDVDSPNPMLITPSAIPCNGGSFSLTAPNFSFLTYQWWKGSNTADILSNANSLNFPVFNPATDNGTYHVRITYLGNPNSCLNQVLDYSVNIGDDTPNAGNDNAVSYCGRQGIMDLNVLLTGSFDTTGTWSETTSSNMLTNNLWDSSTISFGTYQFNYNVAGSCNLSDDASISITIKEIPQIPTASADPIICETQDLNLFATTVTNAVYHWTGPNGFTSNVQNPILNAISSNQNGTYTVYATDNGCQSGDSSVAVLVNPLPDFVLNQDCVNREYQVWVTKLNETSFDENNSTFSWTGPNNFTGNQQVITITGAETGIYSLTITNEFGCETTNVIDVPRTNCFIPNVITPNNDNANESFDLTGFDVVKLEIYSRWGRKVYEKNNYLDEWHGQNMDGGLLPDSTYYYIIKLATEETKTGWIFLHRG
ncbi:gliding motility-associated C-terminal domain-containing protein [Flavobacterium wongokense]|uniref:gliding motility-associated C-terminal domain-containing protein n=1 Tax=Flavobacterium wongokense TaxID=2910674 RepID=UPI001F23B3B5|nr:gliding motility-associated C-terminal domain-containing protein [Flavobacterium sp. WG47]MCF6133115.1 gliding motility-associated C-terminal domain-containing protein [Flavobacterium sp. WG47]